MIGRAEKKSERTCKWKEKIHSPSARRVKGREKYPKKRKRLAATI